MSESMSNISNQEETTDTRNWEWFPCIYDFKQITDCKVIVWNFSPYVMLSSREKDVNFYL